MAVSEKKKLVDYVLLAEFDIEKGSTVSFQYPEPTGTDVTILAELMLPDGAHNRDQDWTVFFLNQTLPESATRKMPEKPKETRKSSSLVLDCYVYEYTESSQGWDMLGDSQKRVRLDPDYLVILEADNITELRSIRRSPTLQYQQMEPLFDVLITEDAAMGIRFTEENFEKSFLAYLEEFTKFRSDDDLETPQTVSEPASAAAEAEPAKKPFLYVLNLVRTKHIPGVKRGARTKAVAICTQYQFLHVYKPLLLIALDKFFDNQDEGILRQLYEATNSIDLTGMSQLTDQEKRIIRASEGNDGSGVDRRFHSTKVPFNGHDIPMKIPVAMFPDEVGDFSLTKLVQKFSGCTVGRGENGVMTIFNALLKQQRIIFLGYNHPSGEVANYVLAACSMLSPPLRGFTERAFPYTNLTNVDNMLAFPGYIAGVTNPRFEDLDKWWDVLCNVGTGQVKLASHLPPQTQPEPHQQADQDFIAEVLFAIQNHYSEDRIRAKFQEYAQSVVDIAFDDAEFPDDNARKKSFNANLKRIEQWKYYNNTTAHTESWTNYRKDRQAWREKRTIKDVDVNRHISKLRIRQSIPEKEVLAIYQDFVKSINTDEQLIEFLSYLPENQGGLYPVAVSLFHPSESIRRATVELFNRIDKLKAGSGFINSMNRFLRLAYERNKNLLPPTANA